MQRLDVSTTAFQPGGAIPDKFTCEGKNFSPPVSWDAVPAATKSIALFLDDPDAAAGTFTHWIIFNIPPEKRNLPEGVPPRASLEDGSLQGVNGFGRTGYGGPCPPRGTRHRYVLQVYCLDRVLPPMASARKDAVWGAMAGHILASGEMMGTYSRR